MRFEGAGGVTPCKGGFAVHHDPCKAWHCLPKTQTERAARGQNAKILIEQGNNHSSSEQNRYDTAFFKDIQVMYVQDHSQRGQGACSHFQYK